MFCGGKQKELFCVYSLVYSGSESYESEHDDEDDEDEDGNDEKKKGGVRPMEESPEFKVPEATIRSKKLAPPPGWQGAEDDEREGALDQNSVLSILKLFAAR